MHRHLLGLTSPPPEYVPDRFAMPLGLPEDWDGDVWVRSSGRAYFLRAWNVQTGRIAYGRGTEFRDACRSLLADVADGTRRVKVTTHESRSAAAVEPVPGEKDSE